MDKMEDVKKKVEAMIGDTPKHLGLVISLDDIDKKSLSGLQKEEFNEIASDLKKIGIELKIDSGHLVLSYDKGKVGIINWDDYPIRVPEEKVRNVDVKGAGKVEQEMNKAEILNQDKEFKYKLLDRMRSDCEYYLDYGNKDAKYLWAGNEKEQIETMRAIYNSFSQNEKPEWITLEQIAGLEKEMVEMTKEQEVANKMNNEMNLKYGFTDETRTVIGNDGQKHVLHEIVALKDIQLNDGTLIKKGELGGFIESKKNLSQEGNCWVYFAAGVRENAKVYDNAVVEPGADVSENAKIYDNAIVDQCVHICGNTKVCGDAVLTTKIDEFDIKIIGGTIDKSMSLASPSSDNINSYDYIVTEEQQFFHADIEKLGKKIEEIESAINNFQIQPEELTSAQQQLQDKYTKLHDEAMNVLKHADSKKLDNSNFLDSIRVSKINGVYIHKNYSEESDWMATVSMSDFEKMSEKNGLSSLEFKNCNLDKNVCLSGKLEGCKFENCSIFSAIKNAEFKDTTFKNVTFYSVVFQDVKFENCKFENCKNYDAIRQNEETRNVEFSNTEFKGCKMSLGNANIDLKSVFLQNCSLENCMASDKNICNLNNPKITKNITTQKTFSKLLDKNIKKSLQQEGILKPDRKPKRRLGKSR